MNTELIASELNRLSRMKLNGWNETDVREGFITPLLTLLGYQKDTDYDINREGSHVLPKRPFFLIGRDKIQLDYALLVRNRNFWIIEAKAPDQEDLTEQAIFQAHFYSIHPEVNARYFMVTNGLMTALYDTRALGNDFDPVLIIRQAALPTKFIELNNRLGASRIRQMFRKQILDDIRHILGTEVREEALKEFRNQVAQVIHELRPTVRENSWEVYDQKKADAFEQFRQLIETKTLDQLVRIGLEYFEPPKLVQYVFDTRLSAVSAPMKAEILGSICKLLRGRLSTRHRANLVHLLLHLMGEHGDFVRENAESLVEECRRSIKLILSDYASNELDHALWQLEGNLYRVFYKLSFLPRPRDVFEQIVKTRSGILQEEDLVFSPPTIASERLDFVQTSVDLAFQRARTADVWQLKALNQCLEELELAQEAHFQKAFTVARAERALSPYEAYNKLFDFAASMLLHMLVDNIAQALPCIDSEILTLVESKYARRSDSYVVNYADTFLIRYYLMTNAVHFPLDFTLPVSQTLSQAEIVDVLKQLHVHPHEGTLVRLWGKLFADEYGEVFAEIALASHTLQIKSAVPGLTGCGRQA